MLYSGILSPVINPTRMLASFGRAALASGLALLLLQGCAVNPATGDANMVFMSESREKEIGAEEHEKILASMPMYEDEELLAYVNKVGQRVAAVSHRPDLDYQFFIIDSPDINAMALPGGYVYVNRGLLTFMNEEAELAAVLAHEIGHITARHAVQQHARGALANAASTVGGICHSRGNRQWLCRFPDQPGDVNLGPNWPQRFRP